MKIALTVALAAFSAAGISCTSSPEGNPGGDHPAVSDPVGFDPAFPPAMYELSFTSHGSKLNGLIYVAAGPGPHPTVLLLHGYAGNERNLDLAQALRRAGMNAMYFNYRGSWGSGGEFSLPHAIEDVAEAVAFVRSAPASELYRSDPQRVALVGHSFGGFQAALATADDPSIRCLAFLAGVDLGPWSRAAGEDPELRASLTDGLGADMDREGGPIRADAETVVQEMVDQAEDFDVAARAPRLSDRPIFMAVGLRDQQALKAEHHDRVMAALLNAGAERVREAVYDDDHYFSAHRIALARDLVDWMRASCWP